MYGWMDPFSQMKIELFTEVEVASGGYLPSREPAR